MLRTGVWKTITGGVASLALLTSSTGAVASTSSIRVNQSVNPLVALGVMSSEAAAASLCGSAAIAAAASAAAAQAPAPGCVLPVMDAPPPAPVAEALPPPPVAPPPVAVSAGGFGGISPLLLGLLGIVGAVGLAFALSRGNGNNDNQPVTPGGGN